MRVLVAGVATVLEAADGQVAGVLDRVRELGLPPFAVVDLLAGDFDGAVAAIAAHAPAAAVVVGVTAGRSPGTIVRNRLRPGCPPPARPHGAPATILDRVVESALASRVLPARVVVVAVEPSAGPDLRDRVAALVVDEVRRVPLLALGDETRAYTADDGRLEPTGALDALRALLTELERVDDEGGWGQVFARGAALQQAVAQGATGEGMGCVDWAMWWGLLEELERLGGPGTGTSAAAPPPLRR